ncbi:MAG: GIDE domain-containing protein [Elainellaceae cyanobacterium]
MLPFLLSSLFLLGLSGLLLRRRQTLKQRLLAIKGTEVARLADLRQLIDHVARELGPGAYRERVALVGTIRCDAPLEAPLSKQACVYCRTVVKERYRDTATRGSKRSRRSQRRTRIISCDVIQTPFYLDDPSGQVRIDPDSFDVQGVTVVKRFEPASPGGHARRSTLGYHYWEEILPLGTSVYVMGELTDEEPELSVAAPAAPPVGIITHQSRQALVGKVEQSIRRREVASGVLLAASLGVLLVGAYNLLSR